MNIVGNALNCSLVYKGIGIPVSHLCSELVNDIFASTFKEALME